MSDKDSEKSMDDVLASIRRIVRAEREPGAEGEGGDIPLELTPEMMSGEEAIVDNVMTSAADFVTPPEPIDEADYIPPVAAAAVAAARAGDAPQPAGTPEPVATPVPQMPSEEDMREMIREVVREELAEGAASGMVRDIIKAELTTGEMGGNISRNVLRLIRNEIAKSRE